MIPRIVPNLAVGRTWIRLEKIKKKTDTAANMMPRSRYMLSELTLAERIFTMPQITMVGNRTGSITPHWIESLYFKVIYTVLILTIKMERPMALPYSMIRGRKPIVIMVVPKPRALWTQAPARITTIMKRMDRTDIVSSLRITIKEISGSDGYGF